MSAGTQGRHRRNRKKILLAVALPTAVAAGAVTSLVSIGSASAAGAVPKPDHVVVVMMENHAYKQIIGSKDAPYLNSLANGGAVLKASYGITHPSQPNYFAVFSGSTQGITDDGCYHVGSMSAPNLASELTGAGKTWGSYNESLPNEGSTTCKSGKYAQKHNPWFAFKNVPANTGHTFAQFPSDFSKLPTVSFVTPNLCSDMHDCNVATGDGWIKSNLGAYAAWAKTHNSLLVITYDEDDKHSGNQIPTVLYGQPVKAGSAPTTKYNHYDMLRTLEDLAGTGKHAGKAANATDITGVWN
ncbi:MULTISPECIES: alkaline phosphatase family protein [unclassified Streptomyces]|uniref:alkaline phosphatase family protein n=1 Tax=unclassified Streptomyces TaxID=2593676 RepID=UPI002E3141F4|nr:MULTISPECIES: alkaline phosphatase family protein [unclassified Streptomyces]WUC68418.1 acid phosphatase [Streptomyces sp. NBC_00539]